MTSEGEESNWDVPVCCGFFWRETKMLPFFVFSVIKFISQDEREKERKKKERRGSRLHDRPG